MYNKEECKGERIVAKVLPFRAVRPAVKYANEVAALPYDVYDRQEAKAAVEGKPLSFLNIDRPETQFPDDHDMYGEDVYEKANEMIQDEIKKGIFVKEKKKCYYVYELTMDGRSQTGLVAVSAIDDYLSNVCKKHENTVAKKEADRIHHVDTTSCQTGPIFLAYREKEEITSMINKVKTQEALYDFVADDGVRHRVWIVDDDQMIQDLAEAFKKVPSTYIADGHHRAASAVKVGLKRRREHPDYTGEEEFNYFLSVLFPDNELKILDYNRFVKDLGGITYEEFLTKLSTKMIINEGKKEKPKAKGHISMYMDHKWYDLKMKEDLVMERAGDVVASLDVAFLQDEVLTPILGIKDPRTDERIAFVGGIRGLDELVRLVDGKHGSVAFAMYPTDIHELLNVADARRLMPPKSTWFEPKLRSGLFIHEFER